MHPKACLFISPHPDDAVGSCGLSIAKFQKQGKHVTILTIFSKSSLGPFSKVAKQLHQIWGNHAEPQLIRRVEDEKAAKYLGVEILFEDLEDAVYRKNKNGSWLYPNNPSLFSDISRVDYFLILYILNKILNSIDLNNTRIFCPLAIGNHVDHQIAFQSGILLFEAGADVWFYEDFHYAYHTKLYEEKMALISGWIPIVEEADIDCLEKKIDAFKCYQTQIPLLFGNKEKMSRDLSLFASAIATGADTYAERFWLKPSREDKFSQQIFFHL